MTIAGSPDGVLVRPTNDTCNNGATAGVAGLRSCQLTTRTSPSRIATATANVRRDFIVTAVMAAAAEKINGSIQTACRSSADPASTPAPVQTPVAHPRATPSAA